MRVKSQNFYNALAINVHVYNMFQVQYLVVHIIRFDFEAEERQENHNEKDRQKCKTIARCIHSQHICNDDICRSRIIIIAIVISR